MEIQNVIRISSWLYESFYAMWEIHFQNLYLYVLTLFAGGSHMHLCDVTDADLCCILLAATRLEIMAVIWEQASPNLYNFIDNILSHDPVMFCKHTYPAMQLQCAANISPSSSSTTHGISGVPEILCECITYIICDGLKQRNWSMIIN